jgi:hypothetical protein
MKSSAATRLLLCISVEEHKLRVDAALDAGTYESPEALIVSEALGGAPARITAGRIC